ncbi:hypothetical protein ACS0TY_010187 [Phlomoides rotata]
MLSLGKFPTQVQYNPLQRNPISQNLQFHSKPHLSFPPHLNFHAVVQKMRSELCCNASKTKKNGGSGLKEMEGTDEFEDVFDDEFLDIEDDGEIEGDDDDEGGFVIPLRNMKKWVEDKPRGFGEGKVYDTSVEDKLMEEIEQSRKAQLANIDKLKNGPAGTSSKKDKGPTPSQDGVRVRLVNLPKKKNIHKDLRLAFKEVPGVVNIVPVVSGNEKTRDPICKGIAFVDFKYQDAAQRFIQNFSGKSISFGKVQKQMKCEMVISKLPNPATDQSVDPVCDSQRTILKLDEGLNFGVESSTNASPLNSSEESTTSELEDEDERHVSGEEEDIGEISGTSTISDFNLAEELDVGEESSIDSSSKDARKSKTNEKKAAPKRRKDKNPKLNIPGSSKKLKMKDKAVLSGVFSKYGANATSTVKKPSR